MRKPLLLCLQAPRADDP